MYIRMLLTAILALGGVACKDNADRQAKNEQPPQVQQVSVADFHKAALLNVEMGEKYLASGQINRAKQKLLHALELKPRLPEAHTSIGYFYETVGDLSEAEKHYKMAINYGDGKGRFYNNYGTFLCRQKRFKDADRAFNKAINDKTYVKTAEAYENAGLCALLQPDLPKAYSYLETAVRRNPQSSKASLELANLELQRNHLAAALDYLNLHKTYSETTARSLWIAIQINRQLKNKNEVASAALKLKSLFPKSEEYKLYEESKAND